MHKTILILGGGVGGLVLVLALLVIQTRSGLWGGLISRSSTARDRLNARRSKDQKYFLYVHEPGDVRRTAFLVWKYPDRDDDRWIFIPAVNMTRRIAANDSRSSFVGSDFTYEDVSGRDISADDRAFLRHEPMGPARCAVVESKPRRQADYSRKLTWIDEATRLPLREEYYDVQGQLARVFAAEKVESLSSAEGGAGRTYPTAVRRSMTNVKSGHSTRVTFEKVAYDAGLPEDLFTARSLENPPRRWLE
ncbi:MAG: outer membrane lipoprotein-sorting protein [Candidatus Riflebacteria bacterium]|nr:outer membrane lipoprotein-sorting protein [Candidatus Riflebacteria bacterium]